LADHYGQHPNSAWHYTTSEKKVKKIFRQKTAEKRKIALAAMPFHADYPLGKN